MRAAHKDARPQQRYIKGSRDMSIAIVGAGLSGLVCARILQEHDIAATIYERDPSPTVRHQGGSLDIHEDSGQIALREAGLYEEFRRQTRPLGENLRVLDKTGTVFIDHAPPEGEGGRPEIDRTALRDMLIASLDQDRIAWGRKVTAVTAGELAFADGTRAAAELIIGADGTWSRVRPLLSTAQPQYTGITYVELNLTEVQARHREAASIVGPGMIFALSDNKAIMGHGGERIDLGASLRVPQDWLTTREFDWSDAVAVRAALLQEFADWSPELKGLIRDCDDTIVARQIFALPVGHQWPRTPGVTLVGDAAHVMSPYAGEGANLALLDGAELALALVKHGDDVETALGEYEAAMFPRAAASAEQSAVGLEGCFAADSPRALVEFFTSTVPVPGG
jgi:2-polyprenyl-6-methoxyphenol hydroxylase-like FAD-dependent oxidoreductase